MCRAENSSTRHRGRVCVVLEIVVDFGGRNPRPPVPVETFSMLLTLALCALGSAPAAAPTATVAHAGFLRDARVTLDARQHLVFDAAIQWPATITRRSFVVDGLAADGSVLCSRPVTASARTPVGVRKRSVAAHFDLELPATIGVHEWRVQLAP
jgi:hypothetical protein